jgi:hypothetical protein
MIVVAVLGIAALAALALVELGALVLVAVGWRRRMAAWCVIAFGLGAAMLSLHVWLITAFAYGDSIRERAFQAAALLPASAVVGAVASLVGLRVTR